VNLLKKPRSQYNRAIITKTGIIFILVTIAVGSVGLSSQNNLIYFIFSLLLSTYIISGILSISNILDFDFNIYPIDFIFAKKPQAFYFELDNKTKSHRYLISAKVDKFESYFDIIAPGQNKNLITFAFPKRGKYNLNICNISSEFPFAFFKRMTKISKNNEIIVFPEIKKVALFDTGGSLAMPIKTSELYPEDFHTIKDYRQGEDARNINWKISAKIGDEKIVKRKSEGGAEKLFFVDTSVLAYQNSNEFEDAIRRIASAIFSSYEQGESFGMILPDKEISLNSGRKHFEKVMLLLATLSMYETLPMLKPNSAITFKEINYV